MKDSLKKLMGMFPYFFDKSETSNFYKSQDVTNRRFQEVGNDLFKVCHGFHLDKKLLIWKEQVEPFVYTINFRVNFPYLKKVTLYKNNSVIYTDSFKYEDNVSSFEYSYNGDTLNDGHVNLIIPTDTFIIFVETWEEYSLVKGFPENDTLLGDEFDHDPSLDRIGEFNNIPRKEYIPLNNPDLYPATEPPFNDRLTEDDYHYMNRIMEYTIRLHDTPAPILEIWKLYGINATMENRERLLLKVFDETKHPFNKNTGHVGDWTPEPWEHKDKFCDYDDNLGEYFFIKTSTRIPVKGQNVIFYFKFLNSLGHYLTGDYSVDITLDGKNIVSNYIGNQYTLLSSNIPEDKDNYYIITAKNSSGEIIGEEEITISVRGCNSGDFYVSPSGSDKNNGKSRNKPFKTIQKAVNRVNGDKNLIVLLGGNYEITDCIKLNQSCTVLGCGSVLIENLEKNLFFNIPANDTLILQDLTLQYQGDVCEVGNTTFINNNGDKSSADVIILATNAPVLTITKLELVFENESYCVGDTINYTGTLKDRLGNALTNKTVKVTNVNDNTNRNCTTNNSGVYSGSLVAQRPGELTLNANFSGDSNYKASRATSTINIKIRLTDILEDYDYIVMDLSFDENTHDWNYITIPVSEIIILSDLSGAILNLKYNNKNVTFERFISYSNTDSLTKTDLNSLSGLLVGIEYDDYEVKYTKLEVNQIA